MKLKHLNIIFAGLLIAVAGVFYRAADTFKMLPGQKDIGPKAFPRAVCICIVILAVLLIIDSIRKKDDRKIELFNLKFFIGIATAALSPSLSWKFFCSMSLSRRPGPLWSGLRLSLRS